MHAGLKPSVEWLYLHKMYEKFSLMSLSHLSTWWVKIIKLKHDGYISICCSILWVLSLPSISPQVS